MSTTILRVDPLKVSFEGVHAIISPSKTLENLKVAVEALKHNQVVAFPTETVYGLGASCLSTPAVKAIYEAKNRPPDNPLILHVASTGQLERILLKDVQPVAKLANGTPTKIPKIYHKLIEKFWPGPLTILLPLPTPTDISSVCTLGQTTFGVRMPSNPIARALIELSDLPLAAPSANASTRPSCTKAEHVFEDLNGRIPYILDGGSADVGVESTVIDGLCDPPQILRPGGISLEQIIEFGGEDWKNVIVARPNVAMHEKVRTPGMKYRHYSPSAFVILMEPDAELQKIKATVSEKNPQTIAFLGSKRYDLQALKDVLAASENAHATSFLDLPLGKTNSEISHNLFDRFREADKLGADLIIVEGVETSNEGLAIMNRAAKAAGLVLRA